jgi:hypothetical protein
LEQYGKKLYNGMKRGESKQYKRENGGVYIPSGRGYCIYKIKMNYCDKTVLGF